MPVDVGVALVGAECVEVHPLRPDLLAHRLGNLVEQPLKVRVLRHGEAAGHLLAMLLGSDEGVGVGPRVTIEEGDGPIVLVDDVLGEPDISSHHRADEARLRAEPVVHGVHIRVITLEPFFHLLDSSLGARGLGNSLPAYAIHPSA